MRTHQPSPAPVTPEPATAEPALIPEALSRRGFLRAAAFTGGGLAAASIAACAPAAAPVWTFSPARSTDPNAPAPSSSAMAAASPATSHDAGHSMAPATPAACGSTDIPPGWSEHDVDRPQRRPPLPRRPRPGPRDIYGAAVVARLADILGVEDDYPELQPKPAFVQVPQLVLTDVLEPLKPEIDGDVKVFRLTIDEIEQPIDELMPPVAALGYNAQWPGPTHPRQPGRQGPRHLHQQPQGDDRRPLPRRRVRRLLPGRRPVRHPEAVRARRDVRLRVHGEQRRAR